jgi:hypothetical protein
LFLVSVGKLEKIGYYGLNWKSLSQPAILPASTDFLVPVHELRDREKFEIQGNYYLIMDPKECAYDTPENLLTEMICQRLAQEYQLVEGIDLRPYRLLLDNNFSNTAQALSSTSTTGTAATSAHPSGSSTPATAAPHPHPHPHSISNSHTYSTAAAAAAVVAAVGDGAKSKDKGGKNNRGNTAPEVAVKGGGTTSKKQPGSDLEKSTMTKGKEKDKDAASSGLTLASHGQLNKGELLYVLSMGHRIQFLMYDPVLRRVAVTRYTNSTPLLASNPVTKSPMFLNNTANESMPSI